MSDRPLIGWLELSVSERWKKNGADMAVHAVRTTGGQQCFAMTLDGRWLCGNGGAMTFFDSRAAASQFVQLLNVSVRHLAEGEDYGWDAAQRGRLQCFHLESDRLKPCDKCCAGKAPRICGA